MPILDHFRLIAPFYDRIFTHGNNQFLLEKVDVPVNGLLLDAGGGTGRISQFFRSQTSRIIVADLSQEMLQQVNLKIGLVPVCSHTEKLPFQNGLFDGIIVIDALHHVCDQAETANELKRVLKPGGRIIIEEPNLHKFGVKMLAVVEKLLGMRSHFLYPEEILNLFKGCNGKIETGGSLSWVIVEK